MADLPKDKPVEIWFQDEARIGQKNGIVRQWARRGARPRQPTDQLRGHLADFIAAYNFGRRLKTLKGLSPVEFICKQ